MEEHAKSLRSTFRNANTRSRTQVSNQGKWYLADNNKAINHNHTYFQFFAKLLRERGISDAMPMLIEFITYLMGNHDFTQSIGENTHCTQPKTLAPAKKTEEPVVDEFSWESGAAAEISTELGAWETTGDVPSFDDEEDEMM